MHFLIRFSLLLLCFIYFVPIPSKFIHFLVMNSFIFKNTNSLFFLSTYLDKFAKLRVMM